MNDKGEGYGEPEYRPTTMVRQMKIGNIVIEACRLWEKRSPTNRGWLGSDKYARDIMALFEPLKLSHSINSDRSRNGHVVGCKCERCDLGDASHVHGCECVNCRMARYMLSGRELSSVCPCELCWRPLS